MRELTSYVKKHAKVSKDAGKIDLERTPAIDPAAVAEQWGKDNPEALDGFVAHGGVDFALAQLAAVLADDAPAFVEPKRPFREVALPEGLDPTLPPNELAEKLKP
jgi:hypothetical protein